VHESSTLTALTLCRTARANVIQSAALILHQIKHEIIDLLRFAIRVLDSTDEKRYKLHPKNYKNITAVLL